MDDGTYVCTVGVNGMYVRICTLRLMFVLCALYVLCVPCVLYVMCALYRIVYHIVKKLRSIKFHDFALEQTHHGINLAICMLV